MNSTSGSFDDRPAWARKPASNVPALLQFGKTAKFKLTFYEIAQLVLSKARQTEEGKFVVDTMLGAAWQVGGPKQPSRALPLPHYPPPRYPTLRPVPSAWG